MAAAPVPPLVLRNGVTIDDPLTRALEFIAQDSSYQKYDLAPVAQDDVLTIADIEITNWMIAGMSRAVMEGIHGRASEINAALAAIPAASTLTAPTDRVPWEGLLALVRAGLGAPEVGLARATEVLHKKRPALIPHRAPRVTLPSGIVTDTTPVGRREPKAWLFLSIMSPRPVRDGVGRLPASECAVRDTNV